MFTDRLYFQIKTEVYFVLAVALLILPISWILAWLAAAFVHEIGHYIIIRVCRYRVYRIAIGCCGALMETENLGNKEWICAAAGPLFGLFLLVFVRWIPKVAICALMQSAFNLLPINTMDGGRIISGMLLRLFPRSTAMRISSVVSSATITAIIFLTIVLVLRYRLELIPCFLFCGVIIRFLIIKFPCKDAPLRVQ